MDDPPEGLRSLQLAAADDGNGNGGKNGKTGVIKEFSDLISALQIPLQSGQVFVNQYTGDVEDEERGRQMFFSDCKKRIDYVLVWSHRENDRHGDEKQETRRFFEENLRKEGLVLEADVEEGRVEQYTKIHVPLEVLRRYAETMKIRMPIKESPEEIPSFGIWDKLSHFWSRLIQLFALNPTKVPNLKKRFTHVYERDKRYLFCIPDNEEHFFSHATRSRIVDYILRRKEYKAFSFGIKRLLSNGTYLAAYPLHEGGWKPNTKPNIRKMLYNNWATWRVWYKLQPLHYIRVYFGEKIGLYFAWLGYYTYSLILPSFVGLLVFLYGFLTAPSDPISNEACDPDNTYVMCPMCDKRCSYWNLNQICLHNKVTHMFDNGATVFFAIFMSIWAVFFLEFWKREQTRIQFLWDLKNFEQEEEPPRPEYFDLIGQSRFTKKNKVTGKEEPFHPFWRRKVPVFLSSAATMFFMVLIAIAAVVAIVFYRMSVLAALYGTDEVVIYQNANIIVTVTAAIINLIIIFFLDILYTKLATVLTDWECLRTQSEYDNSISLKLYLLQFVNYYSTLFYIAFFKGRFVGNLSRPVTYISARQEECQGSCLTELCIQLAIVFIGKQLIQNNLMEIYVPRIKRWVKKKLNKSDGLTGDVKPWVKDFTLEEMGSTGLFKEYLEMMIQFGFVTLFVAAFPLAPFFALLNNIIELRADANKFVTQYRREMAVPAANIGVWYGILFGLSRFAIVTNALIIAFTSSFIYRELYKALYSPTGTLHGFVNNSLSYFDVADFPVRPIATGRFNDTQICRYADYREPPWSSQDKYEYTTQHWHVVAVQFIFVVVFENVVIFLVGMIAYLIPDVPAKLREQMRREAVVTNEIILETELKRARGQTSDDLTDAEREAIRRRALSVLDEFTESPEPPHDVLEMAAHKMAAAGHAEP